VLSSRLGAGHISHVLAVCARYGGGGCKTEESCAIGALQWGPSILGEDDGAHPH